jgi:hypothetical protein
LNNAKSIIQKFAKSVTASLKTLPQGIIANIQPIMLIFSVIFSIIGIIGSLALLNPEIQPWIITFAEKLIVYTTISHPFWRNRLTEWGYCGLYIFSSYIFIVSMGSIECRKDFSSIIWKIVRVISIPGTFGCCLLFVPAVQNKLITIGEAVIAQRGLTQAVWHDRFAQWGYTGIYIFLAMYMLVKAILFEQDKTKRTVKLIGILVAGIIFLI